MKTIETQAIITSITSKGDRSLSFRAVTPELTSDEKVAFMDLQNMNTTMTITPLDEANVPEIKIKGELEQKTPSQRLRGVLYVYWNQGKKEDAFEDFYKMQMEKFINYFKEKLEEVSNNG